MKLVGHPLRMLVRSTCIAIVALSLCPVSHTAEEWKSISTSREPRAWRLTGGSMVRLAVHSKVDYSSANSSIILQSGRVDIDLTGGGDSLRISTGQVFIRESAAGVQFFVISEHKRSTIGVCRGKVNLVANKGRSGGVAATGTITIEAGEQVVVKSNGETFRESDPPPTCNA